MSKNFKASDISYQLYSDDEIPKLPQDWKSQFGGIFAPYIFKVHWSQENGWSTPTIISHIWGTEYKAHRLKLGAERAALPTFDETELVKCMKELVRMNENWTPEYKEGSLYLRPIIIGTEPTFQHRPSKTAILYIVASPAISESNRKVGDTEIKGYTRLYADPIHVRVWRNGCGEHKMGCVYAPTLQVNTIAFKNCCEQVLWLYGEDEEITEAGGMNVFFVIKKNEKISLLTPWLEGKLILPGVIRDSLLKLAEELHIVNQVSECKITMKDVKEWIKNGELLEMFGCGTGANFIPIGSIFYKPTDTIISLNVPSEGTSHMIQLKNALRDIQEGRVIRDEWICFCT